LETRLFLGQVKVMSHNVALGCVRKPRGVFPVANFPLHKPYDQQPVFPASLPRVRYCCRETLITRDRQIAGFSVVSFSGTQPAAKTLPASWVFALL